MVEGEAVARQQAERACGGPSLLLERRLGWLGKKRQEPIADHALAVGDGPRGQAWTAVLPFYEGVAPLALPVEGATRAPLIADAALIQLVLVCASYEGRSRGLLEIRLRVSPAGRLGGIVSCGRAPPGARVRAAQFLPADRPHLVLPLAFAFLPLARISECVRPGKYPLTWKAGWVTIETEKVWKTGLTHK